MVVCTYDNARFLSSCLESLETQNFQKDMYQVLIVDNNSKDTALQVIDKYIQSNHNFSLITEKKQGLSHARNTGWKHAKSKIVAFIDDDAYASPSWCQDIVNAFENTSPKPVAVGGPIYPWYERKPPDWFSDELEIRTWGNSCHFLSGNQAKYGFSGSNMAFPKKILKKYNGFSANYGLIGNELRLGEDTELFKRIFQDEPYLWYDPRIKVYHWTPIHKLSLKYILFRSYKEGQISARIENSNSTIYKYLKNWGHFFLFLLKVPYLVIKPQKNAKLYHIRLLKQITAYIGLLSK